ncbi:hypothetical protein AZE42_12274 [Rhizopogon vesiculosus]|uniref:Uncharacterized protein n=1 Tax=Rhizopogon vesiculosus TaxID=180088 RepID=A0A1J8PQD9_9AGAM|nr:hypothetical protein AZE42_12274 [Rhizopogon vesiculosus]
MASFHWGLRAVLLEKSSSTTLSKPKKSKNSCNHHSFKCNYCSKSIEGRDDKPVKRILNRNACPRTAPDRARTEVRNYLAIKNGNQDLTLPPIADAILLQISRINFRRRDSGSHSCTLTHKRKNLLGLLIFRSLQSKQHVQISNCFDSLFMPMYHFGCGELVFL